jgi:hypothetical protein
VVNLPQRIEAGMLPEPNSGCWLWEGFVNPAGYGMVHSLEETAQSRLAHRVVYEALRGVIPSGLCLDHLCLTACCVNPDHLGVVTLSENTKRAHRRKTVT